MQSGVDAGNGGSGNAGFAGYEYQIDATVWLALDLMLARSVSENLIVEPPSQEDIEAMVQDEAAASLGVASKEGSCEFSFQIKSRSGEPWSASAFARILTRDRDAGELKKSTRESPLEVLEDNDKGRFVLITNETTSKTLRQFEVEDVLEGSTGTTLPAGAWNGRDAGLRRRWPVGFQYTVGSRRKCSSGGYGSCSPATATSWRSATTRAWRTSGKQSDKE